MNPHLQAMARGPVLDGLGAKYKGGFFRGIVICSVGQWAEWDPREALVECLGDENRVFPFSEQGQTLMMDFSEGSHGRTATHSPRPRGFLEV